MKNSILILILFTSSFLTHAEFWAGGDGGVTHFKTKETHDVNSAHESFGISTGYRFKELFGPELFYKRMWVRTPEYNINNDSTRRGHVYYTDNVFGLGGRLMWKWVGLRAGFAQHHMRERRKIVVNTGIVDPDINTTEIKPYYGAGFIVPHYEKVQPFGEITVFPHSKAVMTDFTIGARYFF